MIRAIIIATLIKEPSGLREKTLRLSCISILNLLQLSFLHLSLYDKLQMDMHSRPCDLLLPLTDGGNISFAFKPAIIAYRMLQGRSTCTNNESNNDNNAEDDKDKENKKQKERERENVFRIVFTRLIVQIQAN